MQRRLDMGTLTGALRGLSRRDSRRVHLDWDDRGRWRVVLDTRRAEPRQLTEPRDTYEAAAEDMRRVHAELDGRPTWADLVAEIRGA
jgi:hypothetical protein